MTVVTTEGLAARPLTASPAAGPLGRVCDAITVAANLFMGSAMGAIVLITLVSVWWRYVLNAPFSWVEQVSNMLFVWIVFIGAAILYRQKLHIAVDFFIDLMPAATKAPIFWAIEAANLVFIATLLVYSLILSIDVLPNTTGALDITPAWYYFSAPVSCAMMIVFFIEKIFDPSKRVPHGIAGDF